jgi:hypothetical protein
MISNPQKLTLFQRYIMLCFMALIAISWLSVNDASAYERKVLFEDFTSST